MTRIIKSKKLLKRAITLLFSLILGVIIGSIAFASDDNDKVYLIRNPKNFSQVITDKDGKILLKAIDPDNEYLNIIVDRYDEEDIYLSKTNMGEKLEREVYNEETGDSYPRPSFRVTFYDLKGKALLELKEGLNSDYASAWNKRLLTRYNNKLYIYNFESSEKIESELSSFQTLGKDKLMIYNSEWEKGPKRLEIYDKDMTLLKTLDNVAYEYDQDINKKQYHKVLIINSEDSSSTDAKGIISSDSEASINNYNDKGLYNYIDEDGNFYFEHHIENQPYNVSSDILDFYYDDMYFTYDMANREYIVEPTKMSDEKKKEIDEKYNKPDGKDWDPNVKKLEEMKKDDNAYIDRYEKDGKVIYMTSFGGHMINEESDNPQYVEYHELYDKDLNLLKEKNENISMSLTEYGYIVVDNVIYDFEMNKIKETDGDINYQTAKIDDNVYIIDMFDKNYKKKEKMNLYDDKLNLLLSDKEDISVFYDFPYIFATDERSTKMYDKELKLIKDLNKKYDVNPWYNSNHLVMTDKETGRYSIATNDGDIEVKNLKEVSDLRDDYFTYLNGFKYGIMDYKGNPIITLSIFNTMNEDSNPRDYLSDEIIE